MGVSRIGLLGKSLMIKTDRLFHLVVICTEWPRKNLFQTIASILLDQFDVSSISLFARSISGYEIRICGKRKYRFIPIWKKNSLH